MKKEFKFRPGKELWYLQSLVTQNLFPIRKSKKRVELLPDSEEPVLRFSENAHLLEYNKDKVKRTEIKKIEEVVLTHSDTLTWFNLYGIDYPSQIAKIVRQNQLDPFLINLISDPNHRTKVVDIQDGFFFTAKSIHFSDSNSVILEQIMFVVSDYFIWSLQEKVGDNFDHIRERIEKNVGIVRQRGSDYLLYLLLESIIDSYYTTYEDIAESAREHHELNWNSADPNHLERIEMRKTNLFRMKKSLFNLREALALIAVQESELMEPDSKKYFTELKEQAAYLVDMIDNDLNRLESATNLFFSLQSHRLNEVMKTLTILSVIFIPLTFIAGIYGMNFENMPELRYQNGYFIALGAMLLVALGSIIYFRRRKWF